MQITTELLLIHGQWKTLPVGGAVRSVDRRTKGGEKGLLEG